MKKGSISKDAREAIAAKLEKQGQRASPKSSILEEEANGTVLDQSRTPFDALKMKRNMFGYSKGDRTLSLKSLAMEMTNAGYPARGPDITEVTREYLGQGKKFRYKGFLGQGVLEIRKLDKDQYKVIVE